MIFFFFSSFSGVVEQHKKHVSPCPLDFATHAELSFMTNFGINFGINSVTSFMIDFRERAQHALRPHYCLHEEPS